MRQRKQVCILNCIRQPSLSSSLFFKLRYVYRLNRLTPPSVLNILSILCAFSKLQTVFHCHETITVIFCNKCGKEIVFNKFCFTRIKQRPHNSTTNSEQVYLYILHELLRHKKLRNNTEHLRTMYLEVANILANL